MNRRKMLATVAAAAALPAFLTSTSVIAQTQSAARAMLRKNTLSEPRRSDRSPLQAAALPPRRLLIPW
jgi:hypothetical protein